MPTNPEPIQWPPTTQPLNPPIVVDPAWPPGPAVSREEFEALKRELEEMKKLLVVAKEYDDRTEQPHCHMDEKVALLKRLAELFEIDLTEVFGDE